MWQISDRVNDQRNGSSITDNDAGGFNVTNIGSVGDSEYQVVPVTGMSLPSTDISNEYDIYNLTLNYDLGFATLTSSTSQLDVKYKQSSFSLYLKLVPPLGDLDLLNTDEAQDLDGFTQEIRLAGNSNSLEWVVGAFYADVENVLTSSSSGLYSDGVPAFGPGSIGTGSLTLRSSKSTAVFGNLSYDINEQLALSLGTRYFEDEQKSEVPPSESVSKDFYKLSSKASMSYAFSDRANLYLSISEGYRSGGFNENNAIPYDPESVISYEIGTKALLLDGGLNVDAAIFKSVYSDYQNATFDPEIQQVPIQNPGEAEVKGIEVSAQMKISENFSLGFKGNITEAEFTEINPFSTTFIAGDKINLIPEYSYSLNIDYNFNWSSTVSGFAYADYNRQGPSTKSNRSTPFVEPIDESSSIGFLNAQIGAQWNSFTVRLFARNLNNEKRAVAAEVVDSFVQSRPRTIGVDLNYEF